MSGKQKWFMIVCCIWHPKVLRNNYDDDCCSCGNVGSLPRNLELSGTWMCNNNGKERGKWNYNGYIPMWYVVVKLLLGIYFCVGVILNFWLTCYFPIGCKALMYWPMALTSQVNLIGMVYIILDMYHVLKYYRYTDEELLEVKKKDEEMKLYLCSKILLEISVIGLTMVATAYFGLVYSQFTLTYWWEKYTSTFVHGQTCVIILFDFFISYKKIYYKSIMWFGIYGTLYFIWLIIHYYSWIGNNIWGDNKRYLYPITDFNEKPVLAFGLYVFLWIFGIIINALLTCSKNLIFKCVIKPKELKEDSETVELQVNEE